MTEDTDINVDFPSGKDFDDFRYISVAVGDESTHVADTPAVPSASITSAALDVGEYVALGQGQQHKAHHHTSTRRLPSPSRRHSIKR